MKDGPFPNITNLESPTNTMNKQNLNPATKVWEPDKQGTPDKYPNSHHLPGSGTLADRCFNRNLPWLAELMPDMMVEISEELAREKGIKNGRKVIVSTTRGDIEAVACVTKRFKPFNIHGKQIHEIGLLWHYGFKGFATGDPANRLTPHVGCANTMIPEYKAFLAM